MFMADSNSFRLACSTRTATSPRTHSHVHDLIHALAILDLREYRRSTISHLPRVPLHYAQIRAYELCQIRLVHNQQITLRDARSSFPWYLVPSTDINYVHDEIRQLAAIVRSQIIASTLYQQYLRVELAM